MNDKISLIYDTFDEKDIDALSDWLKQRNQLSQGLLVRQFEEEFSKKNGCKYSVFVNSGSSANLLLAYALYISDELKNKKVVVPTLSWATTVSPWIQFGFHPILCDVDKETLGVDLTHLEHIFQLENPSVLFIVDVLGVPNKYNEIKNLCEKYGVFLCIDECECQGSLYDEKKTGGFGLMSTYSFFFSHFMQTIEGGMICTDDEMYYNILKSLRSHGWLRDCSPLFQSMSKKEYEVDDFNDRFTFYVPGFNVRGTEIQAFLGLRQLNKIDDFLTKRHDSFDVYQKNIKNDYWKIKPTDNSWVALFAYPIIHPNRDKIVKKLQENNIETRPLIAGSISKQPFWTDLYGKSKMPFGDIVHEFGIYLPCHVGLSVEDIEFVCGVVNESIVS